MAGVLYQITEKYGKNMMSSKKVHKWCHEFSYGFIDINDDDHNGRFSLVTDGSHVLTEFIYICFLQ